MPSRAQLALALMLLLALVPLASATCSIRCLTATPHTTRTAIGQPRCVRASACCHSTGPAICAASQAPEAVAALLSPNTIPDTNATPNDTALAAIAAESLPQNPRGLAAHRSDSSPPGQPLNARLTPLRI